MNRNGDQLQVKPVHFKRKIEWTLPSPEGWLAPQKRFGSVRSDLVALRTVGRISNNIFNFTEKRERNRICKFLPRRHSPVRDLDRARAPSRSS